jgi:hypothetical protein
MEQGIDLSIKLPNGLVVPEFRDRQGPPTPEFVQSSPWPCPPDFEDGIALAARLYSKPDSQITKSRKNRHTEK